MLFWTQAFCLSTCFQLLFLRNQWRHTAIIEWTVVTGSRSLQCVGVTLSLRCACKMVCSQATSKHILMSHLQRNWGLLPFKVLTSNQQKRPGVGPPAAISGFLKTKRSIKNNGWKKYSSYLDLFGSNSELRHTRIVCIRIESGCRFAVCVEYCCVLLRKLTVTFHWN